MKQDQCLQVFELPKILQIAFAVLVSLLCQVFFQTVLLSYVEEKIVSIISSGDKEWHSEIINHHGHQLERRGKEKLRQRWKMTPGIS